MSRLKQSQKELVRCDWCKHDPLYQKYHDEEWGVPLFDDKSLFEFLVLEGAQAGLSWLTILRKREGYRQAFAHFDPNKVARFGESDVARLLGDANIVRNRLKIQAAISNAKAFLRVQEEFGSFANYQWRFVDGVPIVNQYQKLSDIPAKTTLSDTISKDMKQRDFKFVGSTIIYAHLQAVGVVNDHVVDCFRYDELRKT